MTPAEVENAVIERCARAVEGSARYFRAASGDQHGAARTNLLRLAAALDAVAEELRQLPREHD